VLEEDFQADQDQDAAAGDFGLAFQGQAKPVADHDACEGENQGRDSDKTDSRQDINGEEGEGDPHSQGIDAGRDGQDRQFAQVEPDLAMRVLSVLLERFMDHLGTDQGKQDEGQPMVDAIDINGKLAAQKPADQGHAALENTKKGCNGQSLAIIKLFHA